jgi:flavin reductase (DIM6/NTAB) family NADH-FMN oxidoreductase RutF
MSLLDRPHPTRLTQQPPGTSDIQPDQLRATLRHYATGVTILTAGRDTPHGMTANSFTAVSLTPPLVLVCVHRTATIHQAILDHDSFAISVLAATQEHIARHFADHHRPRGPAEFDITGWTPGHRTGNPLIHGALAWIECTLTATYDGGDHTIFLGTVLASHHAPPADTLLFHGGTFHTPALHHTTRP